MFFIQRNYINWSKAAAKGGYTTVATIPNVKPVSGTFNRLQQQLKIINRDAIIQVIPYGAIIINEQGKSIAPLEKTANNVIAFSDNGKDMQDNDIIKQAMLKAKSLNKIIVAHNDEVDESSGSTPSTVQKEAIEMSPENPIK